MGGYCQSFVGSPRLGYPSLSLPRCPRLYPHYETVSMDDLTDLASQSSKPGELHGYCGAPLQPAGLGFYWEEQGVGSK